MEELRNEVIEIMKNGNVEYEGESILVHGFNEDGTMRCHLEFYVKDLDSGRYFSVTTVDAELNSMTKVIEMKFNESYLRYETME